MVHKFFIEKRPHNGLTFEKYSDELKAYIKKTDLQNLSGDELKHFEFIKLNIARNNRILKTYKPGKKILAAVNKIASEQIWMFLTEGWCGDSAQTLPYIYLITKNNPAIKLRILLRDSNLDVMDKYLLNGKSRSIPRLVIFDSEGNELALWGPRPSEAQKLVGDMKAEGKDMFEIHKKLQLWYVHNRGKNIESEFLKIINNFRILKIR